MKMPHGGTELDVFLVYSKIWASFFFDIFDTLATNILEMFGVDFSPYDGLGSYIVGKTKEGFQIIIDWFSQMSLFFSRWCWKYMIGLQVK